MRCLWCGCHIYTEFFLLSWDQGWFPLLRARPKPPSVFLPLEQMVVLKPFCSPFTGEYYELRQRWFPWQRTAQSTKCSQYSRNVLDEATALDNICLFHLVSEGPRKNNVFVSALCIKLSFMSHLGIFFCVCGSNRWIAENRKSGFY